jgi:hypothetical protein
LSLLSRHSTTWAMFLALALLILEMKVSNLDPPDLSLPSN